MSMAGVTDVQDTCSEDSRRSARRAKAVARLEAVHQRAGRRDRRENGAITDTTIRCGCDEAGWAIRASDVGVAQEC